MSETYGAKWCKQFSRLQKSVIVESFKNKGRELESARAEIERLTKELDAARGALKEILGIIDTIGRVPHSVETARDEQARWRKAAGVEA